MTERLLLLSPFFFPEPISTGRYNTFLVQALVDKGVHVDVICFHPLYPNWRPRRSNKGLNGARISRGGAWMRFPKNNLLRRAVLEAGFLLHVICHAGQIKKYSVSCCSAAADALSAFDSIAHEHQCNIDRHCP
jgi:colanic acid biosynthesis glycosyl transferase WcaI